MMQGSLSSSMERGYGIPMKCSVTVFMTCVGYGFNALGADDAVPRFLFTSVLTSRRLHLQGWTEYA